MKSIINANLEENVSVRLKHCHQMSISKTHNVVQRALETFQSFQLQTVISRIEELALLCLDATEILGESDLALEREEVLDPTVNLSATLHHVPAAMTLTRRRLTGC